MYADVGMLPDEHSLDGFLYSPATGMLSPRARKMIMILSVALLMVMLLIIILYLFNRKIRLIVNARTTELSQSNALLTREAAERWRSERAARESGENLAITLRSIGDAVIAADSTGRVTQMNPVAEALTGWTAEEAANRSIDEIFHIVNARTRERTANPMESVLRNGTKVGLANHTVLISRTGAEHHIADSAAPIRNAAGAVTGVVLVFRDVTKEYAREERLRKSEARYRTFFDHSHDAMLIIENGRFIDCNAATVSMLGYTHKEELIQRRPEELSPEFQPDGRRSAEKAEEMIRIAQEKGGHRFEWNHLRKDGSVIPIEVSLTAAEGDSGIRLQTIWRDLTERRPTER
jgi:PAS domain S-box-containing protein